MAPTANPDVSTNTRQGNSGKIFNTGADVKATFSATKAYCYATPNDNDPFYPKISIRGAVTAYDRMNCK